VSPHALVRSYRTVSPITRNGAQPHRPLAGLFSVALVVINPLRAWCPAVSRLAALRCSDFPLLRHYGEAATARSAPVQRDISIINN